MGIHFNHGSLGVSMRALRRAGKSKGSGPPEDPLPDSRWVWTAVLAVLLAVMALFGLMQWALGDGVPYHSSTHLNKDTLIVVKFVAKNIDAGRDESFPQFVCEPHVDDLVQGFSGQWYRVQLRTHSWIDRRGRSPAQCTIYVDRCDDPPKSAEADCK